MRKPKYVTSMKTANNGFIIDVQDINAPISPSYMSAADGMMDKLSGMMDKLGGGDEIQAIIDDAKGKGKGKESKTSEIDTNVGTHIFKTLEEATGFIAFVYS